MCTDEQFEILEDQVATFAAEMLKKYDLGSVVASIQNLAADIISESDDATFRDEAVKSFAYRVENHQYNHKIERVGK